jgi:hypothetical protein
LSIHPQPSSSPTSETRAPERRKPFDLRPLLSARRPPSRRTISLLTAALAAVGVTAGLAASWTGSAAAAPTAATATTAHYTPAPAGASAAAQQPIVVTVGQAVAAATRAAVQRREAALAAARRAAALRADAAARAARQAAARAVQQAAARQAAARQAAARQAAQQAAEQAAAQQAAAQTAVAPSGSPQQIAAGMLGSYGWSQSQFSCLNQLWTRESGWNVYAANPSGAYGIPQALPGSKMASAGPDWQSDAATQIRWGLDYIQATYGSPCGAWDHELATGWY